MEVIDMKAFLSHTSSDKDLVGLVHQKLENQNAWYDAANIENGESIPEKINEGLKYATHYVLFWSRKACESNWVRAELNAAFVRMMANKCKFMIFILDNTPLPELLQPYKYDYIDKKDLQKASDIIVEKIFSQEGSVTRLSEFVNRTKEIGDIEESIRDGYKLIILQGILGIGKSSLAEKAFTWLYPNKAMSRIIIDFNLIPGIAELAIEMSNKTKKNLINQNKTTIEQQENIKYFIEYISANNILLILKDVKKWLNEDGTMNSDMLFVTDLIVNTPMFSYATIMTTSRYIDIPYNYYDTTRQLPVLGLEDSNIAQIIKNNLPENFSGDDNKNLEFAKRLYGYPLGAKLGAYRIANHGYDYYLKQPPKIQALKVSLAKQLISYAELSNECLEYLKIVALCQSRLRNNEYILVFPEFSDSIAKLSDEAFFAGIVKYSEDGCYKLELLVEDYFYDLAFNDLKCKEYCDRLEKTLLRIIERKDINYMRLVPATVHILTLNGRIDKAIQVRAELTATITSSMWDMYNHREYEEANKVAEQLITIDSENVEARYVKALCLTRFDEDDEAKKILDNLLEENADNAARYYYALGRIQKKQGKYNKAIELYKTAILNRRRYLSPYRELAECYILMDNISDAKIAIENAKKIDESNVFVILLEARLLQKEDCADKAIELLENQSIFEKEPAQIFFRKGRVFDQLGNKEQAKECYIRSLDYDSKTYDAKLCLLNHQIIDEPLTAEEEMIALKNVLRGKRKFILTNIEARYVGYQKHNEEKAIEILDNVPKNFRDKQWYAVKRQLLENSIRKHSLAKRDHCKEQLIAMNVLAQCGVDEKLEETEEFQKIIEDAKRDILANEYTKDLKKLDDVVEQKYGNINLREVDLLPDM